MLFQCFGSGSGSRKYSPIKIEQTGPFLSASPMFLTYRFNLDDLPTIEAEQEEVVQEEDDTPEIITMPSRFDQVQEKGYIDVWWLYDDGG